jgi:lysophospholipase
MLRHDEGFFSARDNLRLFWESDVPDAPRAHVVLVHGYMDHSGRYRGVTDALVREGFAVHAFDYRGHGQSGGRRGHIDQFSEYVDDLELYWRRAREAANGQKSFLLGHSHGALISILFYQRQPKGMTGMILSAPYLRLALKPPKMKVLAAKAVGRVVPWLPVKHELRPEDLTRDPELQRQVANDHLYNHVTTPRWFSEANAAQREAMSMAPAIQVPVLMFWGSEDPIADSSAAREFAERLGSKDKQSREYAGMLHEPMNDVGREGVWKDVVSWISAHL